MKLTENQTLESRIRDIRRKILHTKDNGLISIYRDHIEFLQSQLA